MSASITDILQRSRGERPPLEADESGDDEDEFPCYGKLRGARQVAFMLELRLANGDGEAFDYGLLGRVRFDPSAGLTLHFANGVVTLAGKNLRPVFEAALTRRLTWVREANEPGRVGGDPGATVITKISLEFGETYG